MSLYEVIDYHVTLWESHMIANHPIYEGDWLSSDLQSATFKGDLSPIIWYE